MAVTHTKVSAKADVGDASLVEPSDWNADHTIADATVTLAKMANIATDSLIGRDTASSGVPENITLGASLSMTGSQVLQRAALTGDVTASANSNATTLAAGSASNLNSGTLPAGRLPALTGDVTSSAGSATTAIASDVIVDADVNSAAAIDGTKLGAFTGDVTKASGSAATVIAANAVTLAKMATQADQTFLGNISGGTAVPTAVTVANVIASLTGITGGLPVTGVVAGDVTFSHLGSANAADTTLQDVTGMTFTIGASSTEIWFFEIYSEWTGANTTHDTKVGWSVPASCTMRWGPIIGNNALAGYNNVAVATSPVAILTEGSTVSNGSISGNWGMDWFGKVYGGGTGGAVQFKACQNTSDTGALLALKGSVLIARKIKA